MKKLILVTLLYVTSFGYANETPCQTGSCGDSNLSQGQTNANNPVFNSQPNMMMSGSNIAIQNNVNSVSRIGEISCQNDTISLNGYANRANSETIPVSYENRSDSWGVQAAVNIVAPWDQAQDNCLKAQDYKLTTMEWSITESNIRMCVDMLNNNFIVSDQMKKVSKELALCDHIRKVRQDNPKRYQEMITSLQKENAQLKKEKSVKKRVVGYKEWRIRFTDYIQGCDRGCNGYSSVKDYLAAIRSNFGNIDYKLYAEPYTHQGKRLVSVYVRKNLITNSEAEMHRQRFVVAGFPAKVQGVRGTEIYQRVK